VQARNICGATPLDLLVRREIRMLQRGRSHRQLAEAMGPETVASFDAELESLRHRRVYVVEGCPCVEDMPPEDPGWPDIVCFGHCSTCCQKARLPPFRCDLCKIWIGPPGKATSQQDAKSRRLQSVCPTCSVAPPETRKCNNCGTIIVNASGLKPGDYAYCSERCKHPRCNGRAANGKPCAEERTKSKKHNDHRPRYDQEQQWFCTRCRKKQAA